MFIDSVNCLGGWGAVVREVTGAEGPCLGFRLSALEQLSHLTRICCVTLGDFTSLCLSSFL